MATDEGFAQDYASGDDGKSFANPKFCSGNRIVKSRSPFYTVTGIVEAHVLARFVSRLRSAIITYNGYDHNFTPSEKA